jgi:hypothetical protein
MVKILRCVRCIGSILAASVAGCGGLQPPFSAPQSGAGALHGVSWMLPDARETDLLYVSDGGFNVYVLSYPAGRLVGILKGSQSPAGECADAAGNVFVTNGGGYIAAYRHGAITPFAVLDDAYGFAPTDCSVDPATGDLAVTNYPKYYSNRGNVVVFKNAQGAPKPYDDAKMAFYHACAYDDRGNLYVSGTSSKGDFEFARLPKAGHTFAGVTLDRPFRGPGAVVWDGRYAAVGRPDAGVIYRFTVRGSSGTAVGKTHLQGAVHGQDVFFWIDGDRVIAPFGRTGIFKSNLGVWSYPAGGRPIRRLSGGGYRFYAVVLSRARRRRGRD